MKGTTLKITLTIATTCLALLTTAAWGQTTPSGAIPASLFGMHFMQISHWPNIPVGAVGKGSGVGWPYLEPARGQYNWNQMDDYVNTASDHGIKVMFANAGVPPWAAADQSTCYPSYYGDSVCTSTAANIQDWKNFMTAFVQRYKGRVTVYELWNEPQNSFKGTMSQMVALTKAAHDVIRSIDPSATILSPSMISYGYPYLDSYFAAGGTRDVNGVAMHAYPNPSNDIAEIITTSITSSLRTVMNKYGLSAKPLWDTESSWGYASKGAITNPDLRAAFVARSYLLHWSMGITHLYWYAGDNNDIGTLWSSGTSEAETAYGQVYNWMTGATMSTCSTNGASSPYHALYTCNLTRGGGFQARAVWYTDGSRPYTAPSQYTKYVDLAGKTYSIPSSHQVYIGVKPILLEN
jgi:hypothetical protein